jgi:uncharacterized protein (TIGR02598 family)
MNETQLTPFVLKTNYKRSASRAGFSLVEVAMATAIAALGIVVILGIIPGGLESIRKAGNTSAEARIVSQIIGEIQLSDWQGGVAGATPGGNPVTMPGLVALTTRRWFFDDQAAPLEEDASNLDTSLSYVARVRFSQNGGGVVIAPGGAPMTNTAAVIIDLAAVPLKDFDFDDADLAAQITSQPILVTRQF